MLAEDSTRLQWGGGRSGIFEVETSNDGVEVAPVEQGLLRSGKPHKLTYL